MSETGPQDPPESEAPGAGSDARPAGALSRAEHSVGEGSGPGDPGDPEHTGPLQQRVEAILIVVDEPITALEIGRVLEVATSDIEATLVGLRDEYAADLRGFDLRDVAGGWRLYSAAACAADVERFVLGGAQARLTHAALETLAVIAYRQPVSRQSIAAIRGVSVDGVVRSLLARGLIAETATGAAGASMYMTTPFFLSRLGLASVAELPSLAPFLPPDLEEFEEIF